MWRNWFKRNIKINFMWSLYTVQMWLPGNLKAPRCLEHFSWIGNAKLSIYCGLRILGSLFKMPILKIFLKKKNNPKNKKQMQTIRPKSRISIWASSWPWDNSLVWLKYGLLDEAGNSWPKAPLLWTPVLACFRKPLIGNAKKRVRRVTREVVTETASETVVGRSWGGEDSTERKAILDLYLHKRGGWSKDPQSKPSQCQELSVKSSITRPSAASAKLGQSRSSSEVGVWCEAPISPRLDNSFRRFSIFCPKSHFTRHISFFPGSPGLEQPQPPAPSPPPPSQSFCREPAFVGPNSTAIGRTARHYRRMTDLGEAVTSAIATEPGTTIPSMLLPVERRVIPGTTNTWEKLGVAEMGSVLCKLE